MMHAKPKESIGNHKNEDNNSNEFRLDCLTKEKIRKLSKLVAEEEEEKQIQSVIEESGPKPQFCESVRHQEDIDSNKISASSQAIMLHNEKNHQCTICRKNFGVKHHLKEHQKPRNCMVCKLEIKCPQALKKHQKIHNKPKEPTYHAENDSDSNESTLDCPTKEKLDIHIEKEEQNRIAGSDVGNFKEIDPNPADNSRFGKDSSQCKLFPMPILRQNIWFLKRLSSSCQKKAS